MNILKFLNYADNSMEAYNALNSALLLKKMGHNVYLMSEKKKYVSDFCNRNKINFIDNGFFVKLGFLKLPKIDLIDIYGYDAYNRLLIKKLISERIPIISRLYSFPDKNFLEFVRDNENSFSKIVVPIESIKDELVFNGVDTDRVFVTDPLLVMTRWESAKQIKPATFLQRPYKIATVYRKQNFESVRFFLSVAKKILNVNENINFLIVGLKDDRIREIARSLDISDKVDILGWRDDMPEVMAMVHIYVKTSTEPDVSRSLMEAMASSVVCVVPQVKGISDIIISDYNGVILEPMNENSYTSSILSLINEPVRMQNLSNMAYNYARANFSSDMVAKVEEILYQDVIAMAI